MNFRIITKNHAADSKIRPPPRKIDFRADGTHESHPTAWELRTTGEPLNECFRVFLSFRFPWIRQLLAKNVAFSIKQAYEVHEACSVNNLDSRSKIMDSYPACRTSEQENAWLS